MPPDLSPWVGKSRSQRFRLSNPLKRARGVIAKRLRRHSRKVILFLIPRSPLRGETGGVEHFMVFEENLRLSLFPVLKFRDCHMTHCR
ncbi:Hypothetical predicted protein [Podarcis lilfordi]|uniref:Uncharacterized protein n=1 Tax=Podarcis lilfordi TaxID=74358 RepID=A0AA35KW18_9SAUR|nr:Hypothetical predicted protein [Podarcis lilfordi]